MRQALSIFMALLILSTQGMLGVSTHFCSGTAVKWSISFGTPTEGSCGMAPAEEISCASEQPEGEKELNALPCCEDKLVNIQAEGDSHLATPCLLPLALRDSAAPAYALYSHHPSAPIFDSISPRHHSPPWKKDALLPLFQQFLI